MGEIKICGTTSVEDAEIATEAGATEVGIICHPSRQSRHTVSIDTAREITWHIQPEVKSVLVPRVTTVAETLNMIREIGPDRIQLGEVEDPDLAKNVSPPQSKVRLPIPVAQVIHVEEELDLSWVDRFLLYVDRIHLDSAGERPGGNGITHDWSVSQKLTERVHAAGKSVILAGGLTADNVAEAIAIVRPDGVDVETGIKDSRGSHDLKSVTEFIEAAKTAFDELEKVQ